MSSTARHRSRLLGLVALLCTCVTPLLAVPPDDTQRIAEYHARLERVGTGTDTSISVLLRDGESLKGTIDYLKDREVGIRDEFGHLRPVPLGGVREFEAHNNTTKVHTASSNRWWRTARLLWRRMNPSSFDGLTARQAVLCYNQ